MNKKVLLSTLVILAALGSYSVSYAATQSAEAEAAGTIKIEKSTTAPFQKKVLPPPDFTKGECPMFGQKKGQFDMHPPMPSKAEMDAKKAEIDKRLALTAEQKQKLEKNKEKDLKKIKPIMEKMKSDREQLHKIYSDTTLDTEQKAKKAEAIKKDLKKQHTLAEECRKENMKNFESVLTKEQKEEFAKIKKEQKTEMEKRKAEFEKIKKEMKDKKPPEFGIEHPKKPLPVPDVKK